MADIVKNTADLIVSFQNNTTGNITAQKIRDLTVSCFNRIDDEIIGTQGAQGFQGQPGADGNDGDDGDTGPQGETGTGGFGPQGAQGTGGSAGSQGTQGTQGNQGNQGTQGTSLDQSINTPATITSNQNNYAPTAGKRQYNLSTDVARDITGLSISQVDGQEVRFYNANTIGYTITLKDESASSTAANRFKNAGSADIVLGIEETALLVWSTAIQRWLVTKIRSNVSEGTMIVRQAGDPGGSADFVLTAGQFSGSIDAKSGAMFFLLNGITTAGVSSGGFVFGAGQDVGFLRSSPSVVKITDGSSGSGTLSSIPINPAQIVATTNNYAPTAGGRTYRLTTDAARTITGFVAGVDGQECHFYNAGSFPITLADESASSTAANRFTNSGSADIVLGTEEFALLVYSTTSSRWLVSKIRSGVGEGTLVVRAPGGTAGTNELQISESTAGSFNTVMYANQNSLSGYDCHLFGLAGSVAYGGVSRIASGFAVGATYQYAWSNSSLAGNSTFDTALVRVAAGVVGPTDANGTAKWIQNSAGDSRVNAIVSNTDGVMKSITGLSSTLINGRKYGFEIVLKGQQASDSTEGLSFDLAGGTATVSLLVGCLQVITAPDMTGVVMGNSITSALGTDMIISDTSGEEEIWCKICGSLVASSNGTFIPRFAIPLWASSTATIFAGSTMRLWDIQ